MIQRATTHDVRFTLPDGSGSDAVHADPEYSFAVTRLHAGDIVGEGATFTLGDGNAQVCELAGALTEVLLQRGGRDPEEIMARFGEVQRHLADHARLRWLGPHKGAIHLALASVTNAVFDLWARLRGVPLWELLLSLSDEEVLNLLDTSWVEDELPREAAANMLAEARASREERIRVVDAGYPGYDTSAGWFNYSDDMIADNAARAIANGFRALKLKVGSPDIERDARRFHIVRDIVGDEALLMVDANQQWRWPTAEMACKRFAAAGAYWIEEPTHPDDVLGHQRLARMVRPRGSRIAIGEHISNRVLFKNFMQAGAVDIVQVDALRVGGVAEFIVISMLARRFGLTVIPHVGDMGQLHQHLVIFNHVALGLPAAMLEYIPHLRDRFVDPAIVSGGRYQTPRVPGAGQTLAGQTLKEA